MERSETYKTKQRDIIFDTIKNTKAEFTVKDIHHKLKNIVGLTTIYRLVDKLVDEGILDKRIGKDNMTYYQYLEECDNENHFYLKCDMCGKMTHIDCECIKELSNHITQNHKFTPSEKHLIINGYCENCSKRRSI